MTPTEEFIKTLESLKAGDLGRLRNHAGLLLDESVDGFDLFAGLWWPLRHKNQRAPRREVAWLIAKLYAFRPLRHLDGANLAAQLGRVSSKDSKAALRRQGRFDDMLLLPLAKIEPSLYWALALIADASASLDWVRLTDDLSIWEHEKTRLKWATDFLNNLPQRRMPC